MIQGDGPLRLPNDAGAITAPELSAHLAENAGEDSASAALADIVTAIAAASVPLARRVALAGLPGDPAAVIGTNDSGDKQKALDLAAHDHMLDALRAVSVARVVSEEAADILTLSNDGLYDVCIDPIDGSGSIGIGAPLGLLFGVFPRGDTFLRKGREIVAAGYVSFGHSTDLGVTFGDGTVLATLDPGDGTFRVHPARAQIPPAAKMLAYNASNYRHFVPGLRRYLDTAVAGSDGPRGANINMRWIAAAVGDLHRILLQGGVFMYPADARPAYARGHLRLLYEAFPIAFLIEQAGGAASDGAGPILDRVPAHIHAKTPLIFGASDEVALIETHLNS